jgi:hypothetical protein
VRTPLLKGSEAPTRPEVESAVALARQALDRARADVTTARAEYIEADKAWIEVGTKRAGERRRETSDSLERSEVLAKRAEEKHDAAQVELAKVERAENVVLYQRHRSAVAAFVGSIPERAGRWVVLDQQGDALALEDARVLSEAIGHYDEAEKHANELGLLGDLDRATPHRPTLADLRLQTTRHVTRARHEERRDPVTPLFLAEANMRWPADQLTAAETANHEAEVANLQAQARAQQLAQAAQLGRVVGASEAGALPAPTAPTTGEEILDNTEQEELGA